MAYIPDGGPVHELRVYPILRLHPEHPPSTRSKNHRLLLNHRTCPLPQIEVKWIPTRKRRKWME
ncbi:hypothetical protein MAR_018028 [Mya arenaria]|uniref:Uncharacterized protein n=1 Tax=Mya arenaria TaxID=6604 RepID=A0ABY7EDX4_MYAAR|nr:hypothetical protein MAR_018028 [Mya arenaria]